MQATFNFQKNAIYLVTCRRQVISTTLHLDSSPFCTGSQGILSIKMLSVCQFNRGIAILWMFSQFNHRHHRYLVNQRTDWGWSLIIKWWIILSDRSEIRTHDSAKMPVPMSYPKPVHHLINIFDMLLIGCQRRFCVFATKRTADIKALKYPYQLFPNRMLISIVLRMRRT